MHFSFILFLKQCAKEKDKNDTFLREKNRKKKQQKSVTIKISVDGKRTAFPVKLKLDGELFEYRY